jgi:prepilin peptidase CpaA
VACPAPPVTGQQVDPPYLTGAAEAEVPAVHGRIRLSADRIGPAAKERPRRVGRLPMVEILILSLFPLLMAYAAASDLLSMTISNRVSLILLAGFVLTAAVVGLPWPDVAMHVCAGALVLSITFAMFAFGWIGGGDAKLAAVTALWLGWDRLLDYGIFASIFGGALTLALLQFRSHPLPRFSAGMPWLLHLHHHKTGVPYGIALAAAGLAVYSDSSIWKAAFNLAG